MKQRRQILGVVLVALLGLNAAGCGGGGGGSDAPDPVPDQNACDTLGLNAKIIDGTPCDPTASPVVQLDLTFADGSGGLCSGTLIKNDYVLTAAHCFLRQPRSLIAGNGKVQTQGTTVYVHPQFGTDSSNEIINDVAIVKLQSGLPLPTVPLLRSREVESGNIIAIFGYGLDQNGGLEVLRSGEMEVDDVDTDHIRSTFDGIGSNTCNGDSGGPALAQNSAGAWGIAGITSTGTSATCTIGDHSVFTNVFDPSVLSFIDQTVPGVPSI